MMSKHNTDSLSHARELDVFIKEWQDSTNLLCPL